MSELAEELAQCGRRIHLVEYPLHPAGADLLQVVDAVRAGDHPRDDRGHFPAGFTPAEATRVGPSSTRSATSSESPACSANAITGINPADDTKCSSSNSGVALDHECDSFTSSAFWVRIDQGLRHSRFFCPRRPIYVSRAACPPLTGSRSTDRGLVLRILAGSITELDKETDDDQAELFGGRDRRLAAAGQA